MGNWFKNKDTNCSITSRIRVNGVTENLKTTDHREKNSISNHHSYDNLRGINNSSGNPSQDQFSINKDFNSKKFIDPDSKQQNHQEYKNRNSSAIRYQSNISFSNQTQSRNDTTYGISRKNLEQNNSKIINFPPLRAPQSIVNVRHPFVTESRTKHDVGISNSKQKNSLKDTTYQNYGTSLTSIPSVQNLNSITANLSPYPRADSFPQPAVTNVLFPDTSQFPQSPSFNTTQLNQFQAYDPGSFATTPLTINPVIPQFSAENSIPYPQYENQFVTPNHYPTDITNSQYQYPASVGQIQDSPLFIQSLHSPIAVTDQYAAPNYAGAVRTELIPRLRRPPRYTK